MNMYWLSRVLLCEQDPDIQATSDQGPFIEKLTKSNGSSTDGSAHEDSYVYDNSTSMYFSPLQ
jgi:hypothetical protein